MGGASNQNLSGHRRGVPAIRRAVNKRLRPIEVLLRRAHSPKMTHTDTALLAP
jgi:hypothetical protein